MISENLLMLDSMLEQIKHNDSTEVLYRVRQCVQKMRDYSDSGMSLAQYLLKHNGKKYRNADHVWKFRVDRGNRILYTFGKFVAGIREEDADCIVLLAFSKHDDQAVLSERMDTQATHTPIPIDQIAELNSIEEEKDYAEFAGDETIGQLLNEIDLPYKEQQSHHRILVAPDEQLKSINASELDVYLSDEQHSCVEQYRSNPTPTIFMGGAGTGKSLIALHILADYAHDQNEETIYFTQSEELRRNSRRRYRNILHAIDPQIDATDQAEDVNTCGKARFYDINEYCIEILKKDRSCLLKQDRFLEEFPAFFDKKANPQLRAQINRSGLAMDYLAFWTEIRGIIEGQLDNDWCRWGPVHQNSIGRIAQRLVADGWLIRTKADKAYLIPAEPIRALRERMQKEPPQYRGELSEILERFSRIDPEMDSMSKDAYLNLSDEESTIHRENEARTAMWGVFTLYRKYKEKNSLIDENDLVRMVLRKSKLPSFSLVVVDEVQDYTELQIYLASRLSHKTKGIIYVGDNNQNVNPSLFRPQHLQSLFATGVNEVFLRKNYRCPRTVISLTNNLQELRRKLIAARSIEQEQPEEAIREGTQPYRLTWSNENIRTMLRRLSSVPSAAVLVPDQGTKKKLMDVAAADKNVGDTPFIYTVAEIKGMEYQYVVCYNVVSNFYRIWQSMFESRDSRYQTANRYYFNLLYVAMTRSQNHLGMIDEQLPQQFEAKLPMKKIDEWDDAQVHFMDMIDSPALWKEAAEQSEKNGRYDDAIRLYRRAGGSLIDICRCKAKDYLSLNYIDVALRFAICSGDRDLITEAAKRFAPLKAKNSSAEVAAFFYNPSISSIDRGVLEQYIIGMPDDECQYALETYAGYLEDRVSNFVAALEKRVKEREETK